MSSAPATAAVPLARHLERRAARYFTDLEGRTVTAHLLQERTRAASTVLAFELRPTDGRPPVHEVTVKLVAERPPDPIRRDDGTSGDRPRLSPLTDASTKRRLEHDTMAAIEREVLRRQDPALASVRVLDLVDEPGALVLETVGWPTLRDRMRVLLVRRDPRARRTLQTLVSRAGRWLRLLHSLGGQAEPRLRGGADVAAATGLLLDHLRSVPMVDAALDRAGSVVHERPEDVYPSSYALVRSHGDFAPRNLFVTPDDRIAGFDVVGRWRAPAAQDLAYFLVALRFSRLQVSSGGRAISPSTLRSAQTALLDGYGTEVPTPVLQSFVLLAVLDRWIALRSRDGDRRSTARIDRLGTEVLVETLVRLEDAR